MDGFSDDASAAAVELCLLLLVSVSLAVDALLAGANRRLPTVFRRLEGRVSLSLFGKDCGVRGLLP